MSQLFIVVIIVGHQRQRKVFYVYLVKERVTMKSVQIRSKDSIDYKKIIENVW